MKVPNVFIPEKILDEKIKSLESVKEKDIEIGSLTDFILKEGSYSKHVFYSEVHKFTYERLYSSISKTDVIDSLYIGYSSSGDKFTPALDILKFQDAQTMKSNIGNMIGCARKLNVNDSLKVYLIVNGSCACFVYTSEQSQEGIVDIYKEKFGFKEVGQ